MSSLHEHEATVSVLLLFSAHSNWTSMYVFLSPPPYSGYLKWLNWHDKLLIKWKDDDQLLQVNTNISFWSQLMSILMLCFWVFPNVHFLLWAKVEPVLCVLEGHCLQTMRSFQKTMHVTPTVRDNVKYHHNSFSNRWIMYVSNMSYQCQPASIFRTNYSLCLLVCFISNQHHSWRLLS